MIPNDKDDLIPSEWIRKRAREIYDRQGEDTIGGVGGCFDHAIMDFLDEVAADGGF